MQMIQRQIKILNILILLFLSEDVFSQTTCTPLNNFLKISDTSLLREITTDESCIFPLIDSLELAFNDAHKTKNAFKYLKAFEKVYSYSDGFIAEYLSATVYSSFRKKPLTVLLYLSEHKSSKIRDLLLYELCLNIGEDGDFKNKTDVEDYLNSVNLTSKKIKKYLKNFIEDFLEKDCS
ncbi:MAG: hypothetical protein ACO1PI_04130 [Bacteroidota bacterium]